MIAREIEISFKRKITGVLIMAKRKIEVFTNGCPKCEPTVELVKSLACSNCEVTVHDVKKGCSTNICKDLVTQYDVKNYPSVVVNGQLLDCCKSGSGPTEESLKSAGIGQ